MFRAGFPLCRTWSPETLQEQQRLHAEPADFAPLRPLEARVASHEAVDASDPRLRRQRLRSALRGATKVRASASGPLQGLPSLAEFASCAFSADGRTHGEPANPSKLSTIACWKVESPCNSEILEASAPQVLLEA